MSNVEIMEEKDEICLPFAFEREENQSSMKIQNFQADQQDQQSWGQCLGNLRKWMGPIWYGYELSTPTQSDMKIVNIVGLGLINPTHSGVSARKVACPKDGALSFNKVLDKLHVVLNEAVNFENDKKLFLKMRFLTRKI